MKLTNTHNMKAKSGMTLLELTVVILVLLSLISILFIGARAWKKGSDRAGCILNIRNVQQAVRGHANMKNMLIGATIASTSIYGSGGYLNEPSCPAQGTYATGTTIPATGTLFLTCSLSAAPDDHVPASYTDW